jgi:cell division protein ZapA
VRNDEFVINVEIAGRPYPVKITRGDEQEEFLIRKAAKRVQQNVLQFKQYFAKSVENRDLLAMVAIQLAAEVIDLEERNDTKPFTHKIQQLTETLDNYLRNK